MCACALLQVCQILLHTEFCTTPVLLSCEQSGKWSSTVWRVWSIQHSMEQNVAEREWSREQAKSAVPVTALMDILLFSDFIPHTQINMALLHRHRNGGTTEQRLWLLLNGQLLGLWSSAPP